MTCPPNGRPEIRALSPFVVGGRLADHVASDTAGIFGDAPGDARFDAYAACVRR